MTGKHKLPQTQLKCCVCECPRRRFFLFILGGPVQVVKRWDNCEWWPPALTHANLVFHNFLDCSERLICFVCPDGSTKRLISEEQRGTEKPQQSWIFVNHLLSSASAAGLHTSFLSTFHCFIYHCTLSKGPERNS